MGENLIGCTGFILNHEIWAKCPVCGEEFDRRKWGDTCPVCARETIKRISNGVMKMAES